jgi:phosphatidylserine synthase
MKSAQRLVDIFEHHFAVIVLTLMFFGGALLLAHYDMKEEMSRWIEGSPVVVAIVAILKASNESPAEISGDKSQVTESSLKTTTTTTVPEKE